MTTSTNIPIEHSEVDPLAVAIDAADAPALLTPPQKKETWTLRIDGSEEVIDFRPSDDTVDDGYGDEDPDITFYVEWSAVSDLTGEELDGEIRHDPVCPVDNPQWESPHELVGGCEENPGVFGSGGGVEITEVDAKSGVYRITNTWDCSVGPVPRETVRYLDADEASEAWVAERAEEEEEA